MPTQVQKFSEHVIKHVKILLHQIVVFGLEIWLAVNNMATPPAKRGHEIGACHQLAELNHDLSFPKLPISVIQLIAHEWASISLLDIIWPRGPVSRSSGSRIDQTKYIQGRAAVAFFMKSAHQGRAMS